MKSHANSISSINNDKLHSNAIEYLSLHCLGKVKGLKKGSTDIKPIPIVKKPIFNVRSPMFAMACCLYYSKIARLEDLYCVRPSKHAKCYYYANNSIPYNPILDLYKVEFAKVQTLF